MDHDDRRRLTVALLGALLFHGAAAWSAQLIPPLEPAQDAAPAEEEDRYARLQAIRERVQLPKPEPPPEPEIPPPPAPPDITPEPEPEPKPHPRRARRAKAKTSPEVKEPSPRTPQPLVLSNTYEGGTIAVQGGDEDVHGDPSAAKTKPTGQGDDVLEAPAAPRKRVPPQILHRVAGAYPADAPHLGRDVAVALSLLVNEEGRVAKVKVVRSQGEPFDGAARRTTRRLRFRAGTVGGTPQSMWVPWEVVFRPGR